jgi:hypothetical protein
MGLLDEAIRQHLELKRRRGGDPSEIAREEREALEPVLDEIGAVAATDAPAVEPLLEGEAPQSVPPHPDPELAAEDHPEQPPTQAFSSVGEETAELDMRAVLEADARLDGAPSQQQEPVSAAPPAAEDSFEWEVPPGEPAPPPEPGPGQERLSFE